MNHPIFYYFFSFALDNVVAAEHDMEFVFSCLQLELQRKVVHLALMTLALPDLTPVMLMSILHYTGNAPLMQELCASDTSKKCVCPKERCLHNKD